MFESAIMSTVFIVLGCGAALVALTYAPAMLLKRWQRRDLVERCRGKLVLTYDDGPDPLLTPSLLEVLRRHNAQATFFLLGFRAQRSPAMCDLLVRAGHELGCHSQMHLNSHLVPPWRSIANMNAGYRHMERWMTGHAPFRPPFGKMTTWLWLAVHLRRAPVRWWTVDGCDTHRDLPDPRVLAEHIVEQGGAVVLLHSHDRGQERHNYVLALTEELLIAGERAGLQCCPMQDLYPSPFAAVAALEKT